MKPQNKKPLEFGQLTLEPGIKYRVLQQFQDYDCKFHQPGEEWTFLGYDFLPYDAGYTLYISSGKDHEAVIRMQEHPESQERILAGFEQYVTPAQQGAASDPRKKRAVG